MIPAPRITECPTCGRQKWARLDLWPGEPEPPCGICAAPLGAQP
jgi:hypothetical protein